MSPVTVPNDGVSTDTSRRQMNDGTLTKRTGPACSPSHWTNASMKPHGASMPTRVSGTVRCTQPSSTAAVDNAITPWPQWSL